MEPVLTTNAVPTGTEQPIIPIEEAGQNNDRMVTSDFETFLRMLTTQLENQDPLNPMESSEFAVQLATFSGVEQQVRTNDLLNSLVTQTDATGLADLAGWVGMEAKSRATYVFDGSSLTLEPDVYPGADRAILVISNDIGEELGRVDIPNDGAAFNWLGTGTGGDPLPPGSYQFSVEGFAGQTRLGSTPLEEYKTVREVQIGATGPLLVMSDGSRVLAEAVNAVRAAPTEPDAT